MDGVELPSIPVAGRLCPPGKLLFLGFLVVVRYSFLIIDAVDQVESMSSSSSFTPEHEQLLIYYLAWTLAFLAMLLPPFLANSPRLMRLAARAMNSLFPVYFDEHA